MATDRLIADSTGSVGPRGLAAHHSALIGKFTVKFLCILTPVQPYCIYVWSYATEANSFSVPL